MKIIVIPGKPLALRRPRFTKFGKVYNSQREEMEYNSFIIKSQWNEEKLSGSLKISIVFYMQIPKSYSKKKKNSFINKLHSIKPDIDNLEKGAYDCMCNSGSVFNDDCQIALVESAKVWSDNARTEFIVETIDDEFNEIKFWTKDK